MMEDDAPSRTKMQCYLFHSSYLALCWVAEASLIAYLAVLIKAYLAGMFSTQTQSVL